MRRVVEAASNYASGTGPAIRSVPVSPPTLFPNQLHLTAHPIDAVTCEEDVEANKPVLFAACRACGTSGILSAYRVIQLTHVLNTLLLYDARKPDWLQLHALPFPSRGGLRPCSPSLSCWPTTFTSAPERLLPCSSQGGHQGHRALGRT